MLVDIPLGFTSHRRLDRMDYHVLGHFYTFHNSATSKEEREKCEIIKLV